jgi:hypothetical protein
MTPARVFLLCIALLLFYLLFLKPGNPLFQFATDLADELSSVAAGLARILRAFLAGYCGYVLTALLLNFSRIETFNDFWLVLSTRPSRLGGSGLLGVFIGILVACWSYARHRPKSLVQDRFIRGRQLGDTRDQQENISLEKASQRRDLNKSENKKNEEASSDSK